MPRSALFPRGFLCTSSLDYLRLADPLPPENDPQRMRRDVEQRCYKGMADGSRKGLRTSPKNFTASSPAALTKWTDEALGRKHRHTLAKKTSAARETLLPSALST